jgi:hypothetical protein
VLDSDCVGDRQSDRQPRDQDFPAEDIVGRECLLRRVGWDAAALGS